MKTTIAIVFFFLFCLAQQGLAQNQAKSYSQKTLLKNWALSRCLAQVYTDKETKDDANATATAFLEFGRQPINVYEAIEKIVEKYAQKQYYGSINSEFNTMKCIDLYNSIELDKLISKLYATK